MRRSRSGSGHASLGARVLLALLVAGCGGAESYVRTPARADGMTWNTIIGNAQLMSCSTKGPDPINGLVVECADGGTVVFGRDQGDDARAVDDPQHYLLEGRCFGAAAKFCSALVGQLVSPRSDAPPAPSGQPSAPVGTPSTAGDAELAACMPGKTLTDCAKAFKVKVPPIEEPGFAYLPQFGLEMSIASDRKSIDGLIIHFFSKKEGSYEKTFRGIGAKSTEKQIFAEFGHPQDVLDSVVPEYGDYPNAKDHLIVYPTYRFQFYDDKLASIIVLPP
ncbi:MAG: hypothetical protein U0414_17305 [Polyangiaceae bacterium]